MKTIKELIETIKISYYYKLDDNTEIITNPINYIKKYLEYGDKLPEELMNFFYSNKGKDRLTHTAFIYLMGIMIYNHVQNINVAINHYVNKKNNSENSCILKEFLYDWFLVCFFHDFGYEVVTSQEIDSPIFEAKSKEKILDKCVNILKEFQNKNIDVIPDQINVNLINYHAYRSKYRNEREFIDHGFFSGTYFIKERRDKYNALSKNENRTKWIDDSTFIDKNTNLIWSQFILENIHEDVAAIIMAHNVFFIKENDTSYNHYKECGLDSLIIRQPIFKYTDYPLYFLLVLVDTLDLYKYIQRNYCEEISNLDVYHKALSDVSFEFCNNSIIINFSKFPTEFVKNYFDKINKDTYWLPIKVEQNEKIITILLS